jgi:integrase
MATRKRARIAAGIYDDQWGRAVVVKVGKVQREHRFPPGTSLETCKAWQIRTRADLSDERQDAGTLDTPEPERGTYAGDLPKFLTLIRNRVGYKSDRSHASAWLPLIGHLRREAIRPSHVTKAVATWQEAGKSARTIRHRIRVLRELYQLLDGAHARPPVKGVKLPRIPEAHPVRVDTETIQAVAASLKQGLRSDKAHGPKRTVRPTKHTPPAITHARFLVYATTGQRPAQIGRAKPEDIDLKRGIWFVRAAKRGLSVPFPLDAEGKHAWQTFITADAWGPFDPTDFAKTIRRHGWPEKTRPYAMRSTFAIDHLLAGTPLGDLQGLLGHKQIETTRKHYAPILLARLKKTIGRRKLRLA